MESGNFEPPCPLCGLSLSSGLITEDRALRPRNVYASTKLHQEHLVEAYAREHGIGASLLRFHNVYGPRMPRNTPYAGVAAIFLSALAAGQPPRVFEDGGQRRDFVHVRDVATSVCAALEHHLEEPVAFNVASGDPRTVLEMARALALAVDAALEPEVVGGWRAGDVRHVVASPDRLRETFGIFPGTGFADGMSELATAPLRD